MKETPTLFGGSREKSLNYSKKAYDHAPHLTLNVIFYAETLFTGDSTEKDLARNILDDLLKQDPATYNLDRIPETLGEFAEARKLRSEM